MPDTLSINEFAAKIKERRPDLASIPDGTLVGKLLAAEPSLKPLVRMEYTDSRGASYQSPRYGPQGATAGQVAQDQAAEVLKGIPEAVTGIPAAAKAVGGAWWEALRNGNAQPAKDLASGIVQPFKTAAEGAAELYRDPDNYTTAELRSIPDVSPDNPRWAQSARAAGAMLGASELPNAAAGVTAAVSPVFARLRGSVAASGLPERLAGAAESLRQTPKSAGLGAELAVPGVASGVGGAVGGPAGAAVAGAIAETVMRLRQSPLFRGMAANQLQAMAEWLVKNEAAPDMGEPQLGSQAFMGPNLAMETRATGEPIASPSRTENIPPPSAEADSVPASWQNSERLNIPRPQPGEVPQAAPSRPPATAPEINRWLNVREKQLIYGNNPGEQILQDGLLGADKASTLENVTAARKSAGAQMEQAFKAAESQGVRFNIQYDIDAAVADARRTWGKGGDKAFNDALDSLQDQFVQDSGDLKNATPSEAHEFEKNLGKGINFESASTSDIARVMKDIRSRVNKQLKTVEGIADLKDRWGNLYEAEKSLKSSIRKDQIGRGTGNAFEQLRSRMTR